MNHYTINNPHIVTYPFTKEMYDDPMIIYHGTSSVFSSRIETEGWVLNKQPLNMNDLQFVVQSYEMLKFYNSSGYSVLKGYSLGNGDWYYNQKSYSFTYNFLRGRNYGCNIGGETFKYLLIAIDDFIKELSDNEKIKKYESEFFNMTSADIIINKFNLLKDKYVNIITDAFPVVYALKVNPNWFNKWNYEKDIPREYINVDLLASVDIPASSIISKVNYINGAKRFKIYSGIPDPTPWDLDKFKTWLKFHYQFKEYKDFNEVYADD